MKVEDIITKIDETLETYNLPRRVKDALQKVKKDLKMDNQDLAIRATSAIYLLDEVANDVNIPMHAKTALWDVISDLEALKEE